MTTYCAFCEDERDFWILPKTETYYIHGTAIDVPVVVKVCTSCRHSLSDEEFDTEVAESVIEEYERRKACQPNNKGLSL